MGSGDAAGRRVHFVCQAEGGLVAGRADERDDHDDLGRPTSVTRWYLEDKTALIKTTEYRDAQRTIVESEGGSSTSTIVDGVGRVVSKSLPDGSYVTFTYSGDSGSIVTKTTQTNNPAKPKTVETTVLDGLGLVRTVSDDLTRCSTPKHTISKATS